MIQLTSRGDRRQLKNNTEDIHNLQQSDVPTFERKYLQSDIKNSTSLGRNGTLARAACTADAGSGNTIAATLFNSDGSTGEEVTIHCNIANGSALNEASPLLETGLVIYATIVTVDNAGVPEDQWECPTPFMAFEECTCGS